MIRSFHESFQQLSHKTCFFHVLFEMKEEEGGLTQEKTTFLSFFCPASPSYASCRTGSKSLSIPTSVRFYFGFTLGFLLPRPDQVSYVHTIRR